MTDPDSPANAATVAARGPRLVVLDGPRIETAAGPHALPMTLPGALLAHLGLRGDWVAREELLGVLWPDEAEPEAQHRLRVHLHRLRRLLVSWGAGAVLHAERIRVRVALPCDAVEFRAALGRGDRASALTLYRRPLLDGWRLRDFPVLEEWIALERDQLALTWRAAMVRHAGELASSARHDAALDLLQRVLADDPLAEDVVQHALRCAAAAGRASLGQKLYASFAQRLRNELAAQPMRATAELAQALQGIAPPVVQAPPPPSDATAIPPALRQRAPFVGRETSVAWLRDTRIRCALVVGPPGIGKTRLIEQALPEAHWLRCRESLCELPLHPVLEVLREQRKQLAPALGNHAIELARLVPEYAPGTLPPLDPQLAKPRLFEALAVVFERLAAPVVVDDLQWADGLTLEWIAYAAHRGGLRLVLARREGEGSGALATMLGALERDALLDAQALSPLGEPQVRALVAGLTGARDSPMVFSAWLTRCSGGNPFYALEVLRHLFEAGQLHDEHGEWSTEIDLVTRDYSELAVPPRVLAVMQSRMARLPEGARRVLEAAAILDDAARPHADALAGLAGLTVDAVADAWDQLAAAGFLFQDRIAHDIVRQSVQQSLSAARRERLHRRAAEFFEGSHARAPVDAGVIARHWRLAGEHQRALPAAMQAAQALRERGALDASAQAFAEVARVAVDPALRLRAEAAAAEHLLLSDLKAERTALERIAAQLGTLPAGDESRSLQVRVHAALADNAVYAGDLARAAQHIAALAPVLGAVPRHERLHALETTIEVAMRRGEFDAAHAALARARAEHPGNVTFDICEAMLAWSEVRLADAVRGFQRVVREHPEQCRYIMVENDLGVALLAQGDLPGAELWVRRSLASWADVPHAQCLSRLNLGSVLTSAGRWSEAHDALAAALALAREQHSGLFEGEALHRLGRLSLLCGRADPALASLEAALACVPGDGDPLRLAQWHAQTVGAALAAGRPKAAEQHLAQAHACLDGRTHALAQARVARAEAWLALSRSATAPAQTAAQRMQTLARTHGLDELTAEADLLRARAHELGGEGPAAAALADQARTLAERRGCADLIWRAHGLLARVGGAAEHAVRASSLADALFTAAQALSPDRVAAARMEPRAD